MRILSKKTLKEFWQKHPDAEYPLRYWYDVTRKADWDNFSDVRQNFRTADVVGICVVFNIGGNKYRLITKDINAFTYASSLRTKSMIREVGKMTAVVNIDEKKYGRLLSRTLPRVIKNDDELEIINDLISKERTPEEDELFLLVSSLVENYEDQHHSIESLSPHQFLKSIMEDREIKQKDIVHLFGSQGIASEVINGKRAISKTQAKKLAEFFNVSVEHFV